MRHLKGSILMLGAILPTTGFAQTVTVTLTSPQNGQNLYAGATVNWSIGLAVSSGDNAGLALVLADLTQDDSNPALLDIPPATAVPAAMANFSRPAGISNAGESEPSSAYTGLQRGPAGGRNLKQIGGGQNTLGQTLSVGSGLAENAVVDAGVGQSGPVEVASGSFQAPSAAGNYVFRLENILANVLMGVNAPPNSSPVAGAPNIAATNTTITFAVVPCDACDADCNGAYDGSDIQGFVAAMIGSTQGPCSPCAGDMDGGGAVTPGDVGAFVSCLVAP